jgi:hypothetical protein
MWEPVAVFKLGGRQRCSTLSPGCRRPDTVAVLYAIVRTCFTLAANRNAVARDSESIYEQGVDVPIVFTEVTEQNRRPASWTSNSDPISFITVLSPGSMHWLAPMRRLAEAECCTWRSYCTVDPHCEIKDSDVSLLCSRHLLRERKGEL